MVVDDHPLIIEGVRAMLENDAAVSVVAVASDRSTAREMAERATPDIVLLDIQLGSDSGLDVIDDLAVVSPGSAVIVLSVRDDAHSVREAARRGARGYVLKGTSQDEIRRAVARVSAGFSYFGPDVSGHLLEAARTSPGRAVGPRVELTQREREVLRLAATGMTNEAIADALGLKPDTIKTHLSKAFVRLGARDRASAVAIAIRSRLL